MRILLNKVIKVDDIEIEFSVSSTTLLNPLMIRAFVIFPTGGMINHKEPFYKKKKKDTIIKTFEDRKDDYVKHILKARKEYDNTRKQRINNN